MCALIVIQKASISLLLRPTRTCSVRSREALIETKSVMIRIHAHDATFIFLNRPSSLESSTPLSMHTGLVFRMVQGFVLGRTVGLWSGDSQMGCKIFAEMRVPTNSLQLGVAWFWRDGCDETGSAIREWSTDLQSFDLCSDVGRRCSRPSKPSARRVTCTKFPRCCFAASVVLSPRAYTIISA